MAEPMLSLKTAFDSQNVSPRSVATLAKAVDLERPFSLRDVIFFSKIDAAIKSFSGVLPDTDTTWTAVGVIQGGLQAVRYYRGRKLAGDKGPDEETLFYMGSITKTFTAALLARTIENFAGDDIPVKLTSRIWDVTAGSLPPEVYAAGYPWSGMLTLGELARHQAGLPKNSKSNPRKGSDPVDPDEWTYVRLFTDLYELSVPIWVIGYSNFGYQILGWALALKWGTPWETLLATEITNKLGMTETKVWEDLSQDQLGRIAPGYVTNYKAPASNKLPGAAKAYYTTNASGRLLTTGPDMLKWLAFNLGLAGRLAGSPRDSLLGIMFTPKEKSDSDKSLGWVTKDSGASLTFWKNGAHGDYHAEIRFSPTSPKGVFVMTNVDSVETDVLRDKVWTDLFL